MADEKTNTNEILNDAQLDSVSGGTWDEYHDLLGRVKNDKAWRKYNGLHFDYEKNVVAFLRNEMKIDANLNGGFLDSLNPFVDDKPATYRDMETGKYLSHSQVVRRINLRAGFDK